MPRLDAKVRREMEAALQALAAFEQRKVVIVWLAQPTLWSTFEKHAKGIVGSILLGSALLYLAAMLRAM